MILIPDTSVWLSMFYSAGLLFIVKSSLLLLLGWFFYRKFRYRSANIRFWILGLTFVALLFLPISHFLMPSWNLALLPKDTTPSLPEELNTLGEVAYTLQIEENMDEGGIPVHVANNGASVAPIATKPPLFKSMRLWFAEYWLTSTWLIISLLLCFKLLFEQLLLSFLLRENRVIPDSKVLEIFEKIRKGCQAPIKSRLIISPDFSIPFTFGQYRPTIVLPQIVAEWESTQIEMVLLHEFAHIRRKDFLTNIIVQLCRALYWWHPLVWLSSKMIRLECEKACDEWVLNQNVNQFDYAQQLINTTRIARRFRFSVPLPMAKTNELRQRIEAILSPIKEQLNTIRQFKRWSLMLFLLLIIPMACIQLVTEKDGPLFQSLSTAQIDDITTLEKLLWEAGTKEDSRLVPAILPYLKHAEADVRIMAAWALGEIKDKSTYTALVPLLRESDPVVLEMVIRAVGELENPESIPALQPFLNDPQTSIRVAAIQALGDIGQESAIRSIESQLYEADPKIQTATISALAESGNKVAVELLLKAWHNNTLIEPVKAITALGYLRNQQAVPDLCKALQNESAIIRLEAAKALGLIGHTSALDALLAGLRDPSPEVRETVVWALDELNSI